METTLLKIVPLRVFKGTRPSTILALLDEGSTVTLVERELTKEMGIVGERVRIDLQCFRENDVITALCDRVTFNVESGGVVFRLSEALAVQGLRLPRQGVPESLARQASRTQRVQVKSYAEARCRILIGQDNALLISTLEYRLLSDVGLAISRSQLGWSIHGSVHLHASEHPFPDIETSAQTRVNPPRKMTAATEEERLDDLLQWYFGIESLGIGAAEEKLVPSRAEE